MRKFADIIDQDEVRNFTYQIPVINAGLLQIAIKQVIASKVTEGIDWQSGDFTIPNEAENDITIFSSQPPILNGGYLLDAKMTIEGEEVERSYIYTMTGNFFFGRQEKGDRSIKLTAGWTMLSPKGVGHPVEWVFVLWSPKWTKIEGGNLVDRDKSSMDVDTKYDFDVPKATAMNFYNKVYTRYITSIPTTELLAKRGFKQDITNLEDEKDRGDGDREFEIQETPTAALRGAIPTDDGPNPFSDQASESGNEGGEGGLATIQGWKIDPQYIPQAKDWFLFTPRTSTVTYSFPIRFKVGGTREQTNPAHDPKVVLTINHPQIFRSPTLPQPEEEIPTDPQGATVTVSFINAPSDMPESVYKGMERYFDRGLGGKFMRASPTEGGDVRFSEMDDGIERIGGGGNLEEDQNKRIRNLEKDINAMVDDAQNYEVNVSPGIDRKFDEDGTPVEFLSQILQLMIRKSQIKNKLPKSLGNPLQPEKGTLEYKIQDTGYKSIKHNDINLIKLMTKEE